MIIRGLLNKESSEMLWLSVLTNTCQTVVTSNQSDIEDYLSSS